MQPDLTPISSVQLSSNQKIQYEEMYSISGPERPSTHLCRISTPKIEVQVPLRSIRCRYHQRLLLNKIEVPHIGPRSSVTRVQISQQSGIVSQESFIEIQVHTTTTAFFSDSACFIQFHLTLTIRNSNSLMSCWNCSRRYDREVVLLMHNLKIRLENDGFLPHFQ